MQEINCREGECLFLIRIGTNDDRFVGALHRFAINGNGIHMGSKGLQGKKNGDKNADFSHDGKTCA